MKYIAWLGPALEFVGGLLEDENEDEEQETQSEPAQVPRQTLPANRYALFTVRREEEALQQMRTASSRFRREPIEYIRFDGDGDLIIQREPEQRYCFGMRKRGGEVLDPTISLNRYNGESLLEIELFDEDMDPIPDNIMLARRMMDFSGYEE